MLRFAAPAALIAGLLAAAPPAPAGPAPWELRPAVLSGARRGEFVLRLLPEPGAGGWMVRRKDIGLTVLDYRGEPVRAPVRVEPAAGVPETIQPTDPQQFHDVPLWFDPTGLAPALYGLRARIARVTAWDAATGSELRVPEASDLLRVNVPPPSLRAPALTPGQAFLFLAPRQWNVPLRPNTFRDEGAAPVPWGDLELKILRLAQIIDERGGDRLFWFTVDGRRGRLRLVVSREVPALPNLFPLVEDAHLDALRARYEGRQVWAYGGFQVRCATGDPVVTGEFGTRASSSAVVRAIYRVHAGGIEIGAGGLRTVDTSPQAFSAFDPLVVVLTPTRAFTPASAAYGAPPGTTPPPEALVAELRRRCGTMFQMHGDAWDFERTYSLVAPETMHPNWPPAMRRAVLEGRVTAGMTRDMVAWSRGWPMEYGTTAELRALPTWLYDAPAPHAFWVRFQGDRVVRFGSGRPP